MAASGTRASVTARDRTALGSTPTLAPDTTPDPAAGR